jgi:hypothetical protein
MSTYYSGPALDSELDYRRSGLRQAAAEHRLARLARRGARTARRGAATDGPRTAH